MITPGTYKHSKSGKRYRVLFTALHSESLEKLVIYECLYDNATSKYWSRPASTWNEVVRVSGKQVPRFVRIARKSA